MASGNIKDTFSKNERLSSVSDIKKLFDGGRSFVVFPYKFIFTKKELSSPTSILVTVPKRNFKKAVDRNLIRRRLKEIYRLNKPHFEDFNLNFAIIYIAKESLPFNSLKNKLILGLERLKKETNN